MKGVPGERPFFIFREGHTAEAVVPEGIASPGENKLILDRSFIN